MITLSPRLMPILFTVTACLCPFSSLPSDFRPGTPTGTPVLDLSGLSTFSSPGREHSGVEKPAPGSAMSCATARSVSNDLPEVPSGLGDRLRFDYPAGSSASTGLDESWDGSDCGFALETPRYAPVHFNDESNLGLARLFLSQVFVERYSSDPSTRIQCALKAFEGTKYAAFVAQVLARNKAIPGMHDLHTAIFAEDVCFETRVTLFAHGAVMLYAYATCLGGIEACAEGHDLLYVRDHLGDDVGTQKIARVVHDHMPALIITVVAQYTKEFRDLFSTEPDALTRFWQAIGGLPPVNSERLRGALELDASQHAVFALMLRYQQQRIATYQQMYAEELRKQGGDRVRAAKVCEVKAVDNGWN